MGEPTGGPFTASLYGRGGGSAIPTATAYQPAALGPYNASAPSSLPPWSYTPPAAGVAGQGGIDLKGPLAQFAMQMAAKSLMPQQGAGQGQMMMPTHMMGLQPSSGGVRNPYGGVIYQAQPLGRLA